MRPGRRLPESRLERNQRRPRARAQVERAQERGEYVVREQTLFMIWTGPVMVLAILAALWIGRRVWRRRRPD